MRLAPLVIALVAATSASSHIVPVPPSTCAFDPVTVEAPAAGVVGSAAPAGPADGFHILYDPQASSAQFDLSGVPPRSFTAAGTQGTIGLSSIFGATLRNDGDLTSTPTFTFALPGGTAMLAIPVTTGLVIAGDAVLEGIPLGADGRFTLIGAVDPSPLAPPLAGGPLVVRLGCQAVPRPDTDQFRLATRTTAVSASLTAKVMRAKLIFAPGAMDTPDFAGRPAILRVSSGETTITTADLPTGLAAHGKQLFIGRSADGRTAIGVHALRRGGELDYLLALKLKTPALPGSTGAVPVVVTYDLGGLLSHVTLAMQPKRHGMLLRYP